MRVTGVLKIRSAFLFITFVVGSILLLLVVSGSAQQTALDSKPAASQASVPQKANPESEVGKGVGPRPEEAPQVLQQLNSALESLVTKVSPAVVQVLVTGYGAVEQSNRSEAALVARQHAVGSGVIVDADGYIMTNAHVVEGAQRIRVVLPMPSLDFPQVEPVGKEHVLDAKLIGVHKESDLALLKIEQKIFLRSNWAAHGAFIRAIGACDLAVLRVCRTRSPWASSVR